MSVRAITWAWTVELKSTEKLLLLALCDHANDEDFECWPSVTHLQRKTGLSRPAVWRGIDRLLEKKLVFRVGNREGINGSKGNTIYRIGVGILVT